MKKRCLPYGTILGRGGYNIAEETRKLDLRRCVGARDSNQGCLLRNLKRRNALKETCKNRSIVRQRKSSQALSTGIKTNWQSESLLRLGLVVRVKGDTQPSGRSEEVEHV